MANVAEQRRQRAEAILLFSRYIYALHIHTYTHIRYIHSFSHPFGYTQLCHTYMHYKYLLVDGHREEHIATLSQE